MLGARPFTGLSLLKVYGKFNSKSNGVDTEYICKHKCAHNVLTEITLISQQ